MIDDRSDGAGGVPGRSVPSQLTRFGRAGRSVCFFVLYCAYLVLIMGAGQRLLVWPLITLFRERRRTVVRAWLRFNAWATLGLARLIAGVRVAVTGTVEPASCIVVMNHQSVLDIPIGVSLIRGPYPLIPTRDRYRRWIPGLSPMVRLTRFPVVSQRRSATRAELAALIEAADQVARGEQSLLIFPEGHRTHDGELGPFMASGLRLVLSRARRPVYCVVVDGLWRARTFADAMLRFAGTSARGVVLGPFTAPDKASLDGFVQSLHDQMSAALTRLRSHPDRPRSPNAPRDLLPH